MKDVVRAACPGCQRLLNLPADWVGKTVRCKHCRHPMLVSPVPTAAPAPTWEPLPEYTPPAPGPITTAAGPQSKYVSAFDAGDRYRGRGQYRGPRKGGWVKAVVLGALFLLVGGLGVFGAVKAGLFKN